VNTGTWNGRSMASTGLAALIPRMSSELGYTMRYRYPVADSVAALWISPGANARMVPGPPTHSPRAVRNCSKPASTTPIAHVS
jgi:hypothetical protein